MFYTLILDSDKNILGCHHYAEEPASLPENEIACTEDEAKDPSKYKIVDGVVTQDLSVIKSSKIDSLQTSCSEAILSGFSSSALGSSHNYPSDVKTQNNIAMAASNGGLLWCETGTTWAFVEHTAAQATQVQKDLFAMIQTNQSNYSTLISKVNACTTVADIQAVV